jgi:hypothetical protein
MGGHRYKPSLPAPQQTDPLKQMRFSRRRSEIQKVARHLFDDPDVSVSDVGARCFDDVLRKVSK